MGWWVGGLLLVGREEEKAAMATLPLFPPISVFVFCCFHQKPQQLFTREQFDIKIYLRG
jgi:hypothetical protein